MSYNYDKKRINYMLNTMLHAYIVFFQTDKRLVEEISIRRIHAIRNDVDVVLESFGMKSSWTVSWALLDMVKRCAFYKVYGKVLTE